MPTWPGSSLGLDGSSFLRPVRLLLLLLLLPLLLLLLPAPRHTDHFNSGQPRCPALQQSPALRCQPKSDIQDPRPIKHPIQTPSASQACSTSGPLTGLLHASLAARHAPLSCSLALAGLGEPQGHSRYFCAVATRPLVCRELGWQSSRLFTSSLSRVPVEVAQLARARSARSASAINRLLAPPRGPWPK